LNDLLKSQVKRIDGIGIFKMTGEFAWAFEYSVRKNLFIYIRRLSFTDFVLNSSMTS